MCWIVLDGMLVRDRFAIPRAMQLKKSLESKGHSVRIIPDLSDSVFEDDQP